MATTAPETRTSRIGKRPVPLPKGVTATVAAGKAAVKGPKGQLARALPPSISIAKDGEELNISSSAPGRATC